MSTSATPTLHRDCEFSRLRTPCDESDWTRCPRLVYKINAEPILNGLRKREQPSFVFDPACTVSLSALILKYVTGHVDTTAVVPGGDETDMVRSSRQRRKKPQRGERSRLQQRPRLVAVYPPQLLQPHVFVLALQVHHLRLFVRGETLQERDTLLGMRSRIGSSSC